MFSHGISWAEIRKDKGADMPLSRYQNLQKQYRCAQGEIWRRDDGGGILVEMNLARGIMKKGCQSVCANCQLCCEWHLRLALWDFL